MSGELFVMVLSLCLLGVGLVAFFKVKKKA